MKLGDYAQAKVVAQQALTMEPNNQSLGKLLSDIDRYNALPPPCSSSLSLSHPYYILSDGGHDCITAIIMKLWEFVMFCNIFLIFPSRQIMKCYYFAMLTDNRQQLAQPPYGHLQASTSHSYRRGSSCQASDGHILSKKSWCAAFNDGMSTFRLLPHHTAISHPLPPISWTLSPSLYLSLYLSSSLFLSSLSSISYLHIRLVIYCFQYHGDLYLLRNLFLLYLFIASSHIYLCSLLLPSLGSHKIFHFIYKTNSGCSWMLDHPPWSLDWWPKAEETQEGNSGSPGTRYRTAMIRLLGPSIRSHRNLGSR